MRATASKGSFRDFGTIEVAMVMRPTSVSPYGQADTLTVIGMQHYLLAQLFLVASDPKKPRICQLQKEVERETTVSGSRSMTVEAVLGGPDDKPQSRIDQRIQELVRHICGIGLGNEWTPPGMFTACMAIAACKSTCRYHLANKMN